MLLPCLFTVGKGSDSHPEMLTPSSMMRFDTSMGGWFLAVGITLRKQFEYRRYAQA